MAHIEERDGARVANPNLEPKMKFLAYWVDLVRFMYLLSGDMFENTQPQGYPIIADTVHSTAQHQQRNVFFLNCAVHAPAMYGAVEAKQCRAVRPICTIRLSQKMRVEFPKFWTQQMLHA